MAPRVPSSGWETSSGSKSAFFGVGNFQWLPSAFSGAAKLPVAPRVPSPGGGGTSSGSKSAFSGVGNFQWLNPSAFCGAGNFQWHQAPSSGSKRLLKLPVAPSAFCGVGNFQWLQECLLRGGKLPVAQSKCLLRGLKLPVAPSAF